MGFAENGSYMGQCMMMTWYCLTTQLRFMINAIEIHAVWVSHGSQDLQTLNRLHKIPFQSNWQRRCAQSVFLQPRMT